MKIGIDLDGVVYDIISPFDKFLIGKGITPVEFEYGRGLEKDIVREYFQKFSEGRPFLWIPQFEGAVDSINKMSKENELFIITYRNWCKTGVQDTMSRLEKDGVNVNQIYFTKKKSYIARDLGLDFFVEDSIVNAKYIREGSKADVFLIDRPYNKCGLEDRIYRVDNLKDVEANVSAINKYK
jgi:uncharacterized HAD superfamily protein